MVGAIDLFLCSVQMIPGIESNKLPVPPEHCTHFFSAVSPDATIYFAADDETVMKDWLRSIRQHISECRYPWYFCSHH